MKARGLVLCALFAALIAICAWISVPAAEIAFTMQTFGVALTLILLGGKRGSVAIGVYLLLGGAGLPVFAGFRGGIGVLLGATGGYAVGFLIFGLVYWLITSRLGTRDTVLVTALVLGLFSCYGFGTIWFQRVYLHGSNTIGLGAVLIKCVLPYLLPDGLKLSLALLLSKRLTRFVY